MNAELVFTAISWFALAIFLSSLDFAACVRYAGSFTRAFCQKLERRKYHSASFSTRKTYPFMHKCNSTLNTVSSIANQTASLPLSMRFSYKYTVNVLLLDTKNKYPLPHPKKEADNVDFSTVNTNLRNRSVSICDKLKLLQSERIDDEYGSIISRQLCYRSNLFPFSSCLLILINRQPRSLPFPCQCIHLNA